MIYNIGLNSIDLGGAKAIAHALRELKSLNLMMVKSVAECLPKLIEIANADHISNFTLETKFEYSWSKSEWKDQTLDTTLSGYYDIDKKDVYEEFKKKAEELAKQCEATFDFNFKPILKGIHFPKIEGLTPLIDPAASPLSVDCKIGEVTLIGFWYISGEYFPETMAQYQYILEEHLEWTGKIRIVGVNTDDNREAPRKEVIKKNWTKVEHYWANKEIAAKVYKDFCISEYPFCFLVDKNGLIILAGDPMSMNLEKTIPLLMEGKSLPEERASPQESQEADIKLKDKAFTYEVCKASLEEFVRLHAEQYAKMKDILLKAVFKKKLKKGVLEEINSYIESTFKRTLNKKEDASKINTDIQTVFGSRINLRMQDIEISGFDFGEKCSKCGVALGECDQFKCIECTNIHFCISCAEQCKEPKQISDLVHPHGLFFLLKGSKEKLENLTNTCKMSYFPKIDRKHDNYTCDSCRKTPIGNLWICLFCHDFGLCEECFRIGRSPSHPKHQEVTTKIPGHNFVTHSYVLIPFKEFVTYNY